MLAHAILASAGQAWPPFVLVAGLLLIGQVAAEDGLFEALGARLARTGLGARSLLLALLALVAVVTAVLNLDTAVVFLTPVLVHAARQRRLDEPPFLYGSVFMANAASLLLVGAKTRCAVSENRGLQPEPWFWHPAGYGLSWNGG
jgi:arsenical pump membrane protein